jgi:nucleoside-diphosphate-sugar epimerase
MKVLVTGHRGYIGGVMTPMLRDRGHEVIGLDSDLYARSTFTGQMPETESIVRDVRDLNASDLPKVDAIIHLAGLSNDPLGNLDPDVTDEINHRATVKLAELAKSAGIERFLFSSSCSNYGAAGDDLIDETGRFNPVTPYAISKVDSEKDLAKLADDGFSPTFMRSATAYGVSPRLRFDLVLNNLTAWAFATGRVLLKSDGTPWRPIVHIRDISSAFIAALEAPRETVHLEAFNVGDTGENYRMSELAEIVAETVPGAVVEIAEGAGPDKRCYRVDCSKIRRALPAFQPQWTARKGARELYEAYKAVGLTVEDFEGPRFQRVAHLRMLMEEGRLSERLRFQGGGEQAAE